MDQQTEQLIEEAAQVLKTADAGKFSFLALRQKARSRIHPILIWQCQVCHLKSSFEQWDR